MHDSTESPTHLRIGERQGRRNRRMNRVWQGLVAVLFAALLCGCPGTTHTVKLGYLYQPEETVTSVMHYGGSAAVSLGGTTGEFSVEGCALFTYVHVENANHHNLPGSYCLEVEL